MRPISRLLSCLPVLLCVLGCGSGIAADPYVLPTFSGTAPAYSLYHAYGDSITAGATLADPATQVYAALVAKADGLTLTDHAIGGDQACDLPKRQIFPAMESTSVAVKGLYSVLVSTNDLDIKGPGPYETVFNLCHQAAVAWLAVPVEQKVLATSTAVTTSGPVFLETANQWNALTTNGPGATLSFPFTRTEAGALYLWYRITDGSTGAFTYAVDGTVIGTRSSGTTPAMQTFNGTGSSLALLRIPGISAGSHVATITQISAGPTAVGIVAVGMPSATLPGLPLVLVGTTPRQLAGSGAPCASLTSACLAYIADIQANVSLFAGDGLNVKLFDSQKYMFGNSNEMSDNVHPNALGQLQLAHAVLDVLNPPVKSAVSQ